MTNPNGTSAESDTRRNPYLRLFVPFMLIVTFLAFFRIGSVTLFDYDEAIYAQAAREMLQADNWLNPTYTGENFYDKPVFYYWLTVLSYKAFGINEFAARLPSSLFGVLLVLAVLLFLHRVWGPERALYGASALAFSLFFSVYSRACVMDITLTFFIACAIFSFHLSLVHRREWVYGFYGFAAFAFLTKGLIGIVFPFGVCAVYVFVRGRWKGLKTLLSLKGTLLFLILAGPWFFAQLWVNGWEFFDQFIIAQHFRRFTGAMQGHKGPLYYYLPVLILGGFPWIAFFPSGLIRIWKDPAGRDLGLLAVVWAALIILFFSLARTKLPNYILPSFPAVILISSYGMVRGPVAGGQGDKGFALWHKCAHIFVMVLSLVFCSAFLFLGIYPLPFGVQFTLWPYAAAAALLVMALVAAAATFRNREYPLVTALAMALFILVLSAGAAPAASRHLQGTLHRYSLYIKNEAPKDARIISYRLSKPSLVFYSGRFVERFWSMEELRPLLGERKVPGRQRPLVAVTKAKEVRTLKDAGFTLVDTDDTYALLKND